jgi:hypothetical protein
VYRTLTIGGILVLLLVGSGALIAWRATQRVPEFYQQALCLPKNVDASASKLERRVLNVRNDIEDTGQWEASFTDQEINAWVVTQMDERFAGMLPDSVHDPRLVIEDGRAHVACQYQSGSVSVVLSLTVRVYLVDEPNVFAIQIDAARAGLLPIPLTKIVSSLGTATRHVGLNVRWKQTDGSPVALVTLPVENEDLRDDVLLKSLELRDGVLFVAGGVRETLDLTAAVDQSAENVNSQR